MRRLSVNINKVATIRNARGGNDPDVVQFAIDCEKYGAEGITVHPRPDERHIRYQDVYELKKVVKTEFNIEGYPSASFIKMVLEIKPDQVTLVPDPPDVLTSNAGWNVQEKSNFLIPILQQFRAAGIRSSIFMETDVEQIQAAAKIGVDRIELYTGPFAAEFERIPEKAIAPYIIAAETADKNQLGINAGHDLNLKNLSYFKENITSLMETSIGHALISDALYFGIENTIQMYLGKLK